MINSKLAELFNIDIASFSYGTKKECKDKHIIIPASQLDFNYQPQYNKGNKNLKRLAFELKTNEKSLYVHFNITIYIDFKYKKKDFPERDQIFYVHTGLIPQVIAFLRGYLFSATQNSPILIIIPFIDVPKSIRDKLKPKQKAKNKNSKD